MNRNSNSDFRTMRRLSRQNLKRNYIACAADTPHVHLLTDTPLYEHSGNNPHADLYPSIKIKAKHELSVPRDRHYSIIHIGLIFFAFAMIGWCWEVLYQFILDGIMVNRGSLWGPWVPIYGVGGTCYEF